MKIEKLKDIIVSLEKEVVAEVRKVVEKMKVVVVSKPKVVVEVQERPIEILVQVQQRLQALIAELVEHSIKGRHQGWKTML